MKPQVMNLILLLQENCTRKNSIYRAYKKRECKKYKPKQRQKSDRKDFEANGEG
jgi:hypothetical protein